MYKSKRQNQRHFQEGGMQEGTAGETPMKGSFYHKSPLCLDHHCSNLLILQKQTNTIMTIKSSGQHSGSTKLSSL